LEIVEEEDGTSCGVDEDVFRPRSKKRATVELKDLILEQEESEGS